MTTQTEARRAAARRRSARRSWWSDGLEAAVWIAAAAGIALNIHSGGLLLGTASDALREAGRLLGIVMAILMMTQVALASRAPWVEHVLGHDRAIAKHARLGKYALLILPFHLSLIVASEARNSGLGVIDSFWNLTGRSAALAATAIAAGLFLVVLATSFFAAIRRWNYESWHTVHRLVYVAIALAVPHQFLEGSTFRSGGIAWVFWFVLYTVSIGSFVVWRMARPLLLAAKHRARVSSVSREKDGSTTVTIRGRNLRRLGAVPGQFLLWRFFTPRLVWQKHPYSLSSAPHGDEVRITVKPSGGGSRAVAEVKPGTRVSFEGPLGIFTHDVRTRRQLLLVAAGIGITPIRSLLEAVAKGEPCTVVVRARSLDEAPLLDEVRRLARERSATLEVVVGPRGETWGTAKKPLSVASLVDDPADVDIFVCGPLPWALQVEADALAAGVPAGAIHRERFGW